MLVTPLGNAGAAHAQQFLTAHSPFRRPPGWFRDGHRHRPLRLRARRRSCAPHDRKNPRRGRPTTSATTPLVAWELSGASAVPRVVVRTNQASNSTTVDPNPVGQRRRLRAAVSPAPAAHLADLRHGRGGAAWATPSRWYLTPSAALAGVPRHHPQGDDDRAARGVAPGTVAGAASFRERFSPPRGKDDPLDDAYPFYDAGRHRRCWPCTRAMVKQGSAAAGPQLVRARAGGDPARAAAVVEWDKLGMGLQLLAARSGDRVTRGVTGLIQFDILGPRPNSGKHQKKSGGPIGSQPASRTSRRSGD
jgi:hypothetical protein